MIIELFVLILIIAPVAILDSFDFYSIILIFYIFQTKHPIYNFLYFIIPYFFGYYLMGIIFVLLGDQVEYLFNNISFGWSLVLAGILISIGIVGIIYSVYKFRLKDKTEGELEDEKLKKMEKYKKVEGLKYSLIGFFWIISYMPFAFPYLAVVFSIRAIYTDLFIILLILFIYSLIFISLYIVLFVIYLRNKEKSPHLFEKLFRFMRNPKFQGYMWLIIGLFFIIIGLFWIP